VLGSQLGAFFVIHLSFLQSSVMVHFNGEPIFQPAKWKLCNHAQMMMLSTRKMQIQYELALHEVEMVVYSWILRIWCCYHANKGQSRLKFELLIHLSTFKSKWSSFVNYNNLDSCILCDDHLPSNGHGNQDVACWASQSEITQGTI